MASKRRERSVEELHNATTVLIPLATSKITAVSRGSSFMKGRVDATELDIENTVAPSQAGRRLEKHFMRQKVQTKAESGTCNVCSAPCSSCMHREYANMGPKENDFSDDNCVATVTSQHTGSQASNMPGIDSCHDSLFENADSKASKRLSNVVGTLVKSETVLDDQLSPRKCFMNEKTLSNKPLDIKGEEGPDDNLSCVTRANDVNIPLICDGKNVDSMNVSRSTELVSSVGMEGPGNAQASKDSGDSLGEGIKCSHKVEQDEKFNGSMELPNSQEFPSQFIPGEETDDSEMVEQDVKVCDICGDVGREDLLAICSRCSDGAEHTYCMRKMLHKVPEGDWLCEECKLAEEAESRKQGSDPEGKMLKNNTMMQRPGKRHAETLEFGSASKKRTIQATIGSPKSSSSSGTATLSRESSLKSSDKGKVKPSNQTSFGRQTSSDGPGTPRTSFSDQRVQTLKGTLLKSNSFNTLTSGMKAKPDDITSGMKVKLDDIPEMYKTVRENSYLGVEGPARVMGRSMSLKLENLGRSSESKVKMLSPKFSPLHDIKGLKRAKDKSLFERRKLSKMDSPLGSIVAMSSKADLKISPRGDDKFTYSASNDKELKAARSDGKLGTFSRSTSHISREVRTPSAYGANNASSEHKLVQHNLKVEPSSSPCTAERISKNSVSNSRDGFPWSRKLNLGEEDLEHPKLLRPALSTGPKSASYQKCKEFGHTADDCKTSTQASVIPAARTPREGMSKGSKLKAAIGAAMLKKPGIYWKKKESDESESLSSSKKDMTCQATSQGQISITKKRKTMIFDKGTLEEKTNPATCPDPQNQMNIDNENQHAVHSADCVSSINVGHSDSIVSSIGRPHHTPARPALAKMSVIPEHEFIWQGGIELHKSGKFLELYSGFQAHLSTCASPKVLEVVSKFPQKITCDELPRSSTWPRQFHDDCANEDNIALYFFAKDLESYETSYRNLLEHMIKKDLALKGYCDGVELMIFPSTRLPENSQLWNRLYFLWGVFRVRKPSSSDSSNIQVNPNLNVVSSSIEIPSEVVPKFETRCLTEHINKEASVCGSSSDVPSALIASDKPYISSNKDTSNKVVCTNDSKSSTKLGISVLPSPEVRCKSPALRETVHLERRLDKVSSQPVSTNSGSSASMEAKMHGDASASREDSASFRACNVGNQGLGLRQNIGQEKIANDRENSGGVKMKVEMDLNEDVTIDTQDDSITEETDCFQLSNWKRLQSEDGGSICQKLKSGFSELEESSVSGDGNPLQASISPPNGSSFFPLEYMKATERCSFLVDSWHENNFQLGGSSKLPRKERAFNEGIPSLELALGAEAKSADKTILPLCVGAENRNNGQMLPHKSTKKEEEDDISAALSLSLSFRPQTRNDPRRSEFSL